MIYENLDKRTRRFVLRELEMDLANGRLYLSPRLNYRGRRDYPSLLRRAIISFDDFWLADQIRGERLIRGYEQRRKSKEGYTRARVPHSAAETLAVGEFNRFFIRGLCARALEEGLDEVQFYRARKVRRPRPESDRLIGRKKRAKHLLDDLRSNPGSEPHLGCPAGPNSGLTVRLAEPSTHVKLAS